MSKQARVIHPIFSLLPTEVEGFDSLAELGIALHDLLALGRQDPNDSSESINMAYLARCRWSTI